MGEKPAMGTKEKLTAETLKILSAINIDNLDFKRRFDLLFSDITMLKASAVQGMLANSYFRFMAWMIFLECVPFDKSKWLVCVNRNRKMYENIRDDVCCDPRDSNASLLQQQHQQAFDHPLSQNKNSTWNKYFVHNQLKAIIIQDVIRM
jgi:hypothetical protein